MLHQKKLNKRLSKVAIFASVIYGLNFMFSCTSQEVLVINTEKPALISLPTNINNIMIVDNSVPQPHDIGHAHYVARELNDSTISINTDTLNSWFTSNLFESLANKEHFNDIALFEKPIRTDNSFLEIKPLSPEFIKTISAENNVDAIISIDKLLIYTISNEEEYENDNISEKTIDAKMNLRFQIYSNTGKAISPSLSINDSIYWLAYYANNVPLNDPIPNRNIVINEAAQSIAEKVAGALTPYWDQDVRWYYNDVKSASKMLQANNLEEAIQLWEKAYDKEAKNFKKKARLAHNIALGYELSDKLIEAIEWATLSSELFEETSETSIDRNNLSKANMYKEELYTRYNDFKLLDMRR